MFSTREADRDLDDELAFHIEMETEHQVRQGLSPEEARRTALRKFGGVQQTKESYRRVRAVTLVETCLLEIRYALRTLRRNPGFTAVAVLTLAIGIGGVTAIFSVVHGVILSPLPYGNPDRLVDVRVRRQGPPPPRDARIPAGADWQSRQQVFEDVLEYRTITTMIAGAGEPEMQFVPFVPANFLDFLQVRPWLGRGFAPEDATDPPSVALMSHGYWMEHFGGDAGVLGTELRTNHGIISVVGVMPPGFSFEPELNDPVDFWFPRWPGDQTAVTLARLREGVGLDDARAELARSFGRSKPNTRDRALGTRK
jgi:hypothetical protein